MKAWAVSQNIDVSWAFAKTGLLHNERRWMRYQKGCWRHKFYNPGGVIKNTEHLLVYLPELTCNKSDRLTH